MKPQESDLVMGMTRLLGGEQQAASQPAAVTETQTMSDIQSMYFSRTARFDRMGDKTIAIDPNSPRVITMDPWPELVFGMADGQHTVGELQAHMAGEYKNGPPAGLDEQIVSVVRELEQEHLIRLHDKAVQLPFYLAKPIA